MPTRATLARSQRSRVEWMPSSWSRDRLSADETNARAGRVAGGAVEGYRPAPGDLVRLEPGSVFCAAAQRRHDHHPGQGGELVAAQAVDGPAPPDDEHVTGLEADAGERVVEPASQHR